MSQSKNPTPNLNPGVEERRFAAWRAFMQAHGVITWLMARDLDRALRLPLVWYEILLYVNDARGGKIPMGQLEDLVTFSQSGLSQLLKRVEHGGLVERERDVNDGRRQIIAITDLGRDVLSAAALVHKASIENLFSDLLTDREALVIGRALDRILAAGRVQREAVRGKIVPGNKQLSGVATGSQPNKKKRLSA